MSTSISAVQQTPGQQGQEARQTGFSGNQVRTLMCLWLLFALTCVVMILRIISQFRILRIVRADDILIILAWVLQAVKSSLTTVSTYWGLGRHDWQLSGPGTFSNVIRYETYAIIFGFLASLFGRLAFAVFLLYSVRQFSRLQAYIIWFIIALQIIAHVVIITYINVHCHTQDMGRHGAWKAGLCGISGTTLASQYALRAINAASNICLTCLAVGILRQIRAPAYAKISLGVLLSFSSFATIAEIVNAVEVSESAKYGTDLAYRLSIWNNWYTVDIAVIIITTSLPKIRPVCFVISQRLRKAQLGRCFGRRRHFNCFNNADHVNKAHDLQFINGRRVQTRPDCDRIAKQHRIIQPRIGRSVNTDTKSLQTCSRQVEPGQPLHRPFHRRHRRLISSRSGGTIFSTFSRSTITSNNDEFGSNSLDRQFNSSSVNPHDFVPLASSRICSKTTISAGESSQLRSYSLPRRPPTALTPSVSPAISTGSGRSVHTSRRRDCRNEDGSASEAGFITTTSSVIFIPTTTTNNNNNAPPGSCIEDTSRLGRRHHRRRRRQLNRHALGPLPIVQTSHFSIEYEDESDDTRNNPLLTPTGTGNRLPHDSGRLWADSQQLRPARSQLDGSDTRNGNDEDLTDALELHDVGGILDSSKR